ncbi:thiosulfate oxidation carrier complex protein SoxZ [Marinibactrum halimedae]|uniref:Thiosulfate oxidation carrier complex protein SoxZ n=1 Tax=Marinibactrum halimedae TaxID=1444977 RepID=A0AA37T607_9GAMM|nr:thiosulfate oxidation carrier complex protein SoxZ [Marinibactrum halimedae]MCD9460969.1 thiosulfate oxidation carrier complex protein SoxZ [Marinibactrum halimedae]GLS28088.1 thiosulfate oxidation carrier complex protein SoxZ [Marinibactrum halimedae]
MLNARISVPTSAIPGEVIEIKTLISHPMETGFRRGLDGEKMPRNILKHFQCTYLDNVVFEAEFFPAIAANPYLTFFIKATQSGELIFTWTDQNGKVTQKNRSISVQP